MAHRTLETIKHHYFHYLKYFNRSKTLQRESKEVMKSQ